MEPRRTALLAVFALALTIPSTRGPGAPRDAAVLVEAGTPHGVLRFTVVDGTGAATPARLTFLGPDGPDAELFPGVDARPDDLAVRKNVVYTLSGAGAITVPVGRYEVLASRGIEWTVDRATIELAEGDEVEWNATIARAIDTDGWISGDYHLHTLTHSGHGDSNMPERIISLVGEGVEFAVATDHNHNTDYAPTIAELGAEGRLTPVVGNEVSTPIGHFNAFPLDAASPVVDASETDAATLFRVLRAQPNPQGITPVVQVNHPRWGLIDYFGEKRLDPVSAETDEPTWSDDFDSLEVLNENAGWGYRDADTSSEYCGSGLHSVLTDWFRLLDRGHRAAAVGNSDSHTVHHAFAGYPRNYTPASTDDPGAIDPAEVAAAIRSKNVFTTTGPFLEVRCQGRPLGSEVAARGGSVELAIRVQAAPWIDCDRVRIVVDGDVVRELEVAPSEERVRFEGSVEVPMRHDGWVVVIVEGDDSLAPVVLDQGRPVRPLAIANPFFVDADGDGVWTAPIERVRSLVRSGRVEIDAGAGTSERARRVRIAAEEGHASAAALVRAGLLDRSRDVVLAAARGAELLADPGLASDVEAAWGGPHRDAYVRLALLRALHATGAPTFGARLAESVANIAERSRRLQEELEPILPGEPVRAWTAIGPFPNPTATTVLETAYGPEEDGGGEREHVGRGGERLTWRPLEASEGGYVDLNALSGDGAPLENAIAYAQTWLRSPDAREVAIALGTDDGHRVFVGGVEVSEDATRHGAAPLQRIVRAELEPGWNRVLVKVENGSGGFGLYLRVLDAAIESAAERR